MTFDQVNEFVKDKLSPLLSGFRKHHSTQHALLHMVEKWRRHLDNGETAAALLMDLSKAFDSINHDLLIAKLDAYGFSKAALGFIYSYLHERKQRVDSDSIFSIWKDIEVGVLQGSILGPLLFNIYINDLLIETLEPSVNICNYADDNTIYSASKSLTDCLCDLEHAMVSMSMVFREWFAIECRQMQADRIWKEGSLFSQHSS